MRSYALFHVADGDLRRGMLDAAGRNRAETAIVVAHIGEFDARRLYAAEGYPSMHQFCLRELRLSEDAAYKRIHAARAARKFPVIFNMLTDGRLHLSGLVLLSAHLTHEHAKELLENSVNKSKREIESFLAGRFPSPDVPVRVRALATAPSGPAPAVPQAPGPAPARTVSPASGPAGEPSGSRNSTPITQTVDMQGPQLAPGQVEPVTDRPGVAPRAPERYAVQFTAGARTHALIEQVGQLLGRRVSSSDLDEALAHGLELLVTSLEERKFAATSKPRAQNKPASGRHIPAAIKREVWKRDQGRCTFVAGNGRACGSRTALEFDHVKPVALGGRTEARNLRLLCRAHNQFAADIALGAGFMHETRERARQGGWTRAGSVHGPEPAGSRAFAAPLAPP